MRPSSSLHSKSVLHKSARSFFFFSKFAPLKGVREFVEALSILAQECTRNSSTSSCPEKVTIIGNDIGFFKPAGFKSFVSNHSRTWPFPVTVRQGLSKTQALGLMHAAGGAAVVFYASLWENSPMALQELLVAGVPALAFDIPGCREVFHPDDADTHVISPVTSEGLAAAMARVLRNGISPARVRYPVHYSYLSMRLLAAGVSALTAPAKSATNNAEVSQEDVLMTVVIAARGSDSYLWRAVRSVVNQTHGNVQLVVAHDATMNTTELRASVATMQLPQGMSIEMAPLESEFSIGKARNWGLQQAQGTFVTFLNEDDAMLPDAVERSVHAMLFSGIDVLTSLATVTKSIPPSPSKPYDSLYLYAGPAIEAGRHRNVFGAYNVVARRSALALVGGYAEEMDTGLDWDLAARLALPRYNFTMLCYPGWLVHQQK